MNSVNPKLFNCILDTHQLLYPAVHVAMHGVKKVTKDDTTDRTKKSTFHEYLTVASALSETHHRYFF